MQHSQEQHEWGSLVRGVVQVTAHQIVIGCRRRGQGQLGEPGRRVQRERHLPGEVRAPATARPARPGCGATRSGGVTKPSTAPSSPASLAGLRCWVSFLSWDAAGMTASGQAARFRICSLAFRRSRVSEGHLDSQNPLVCYLCQVLEEHEGGPVAQPKSANACTSSQQLVVGGRVRRHRQHSPRPPTTRHA